MVAIMNFDILPFEIKFYDEVFALRQQCEGIGLSEADSRQSIQSYLDRNPRMSFITLFEGKVVAISMLVSSLLAKGG
jgi:N-acetylglutamate synthase